MWRLIFHFHVNPYRHRLPLFSRFTVSTQIISRDRLWFYFHQKTERNGKTCSAALVKAGMTSKEGIVKPTVVLSAMHEDSLAEGVPKWVDAWLAAGALRP